MVFKFRFYSCISILLLSSYSKAQYSKEFYTITADESCKLLIDSVAKCWLLDSCVHIGNTLICDSIDVSQNVYFDSTGVNFNNANLYTYVYNLKEIYPVDSINNTSLVSQWYPSPPENTKFSYSIYVYDSLATSVPLYPCGFTLGQNKITKSAQNNLSIFPNPTNEKLNLVTEFNNSNNVRIIISDITGRKISEINKGKLEAGKHYIEIDVRDFKQGLYLVQLVSNENVISTKKFIKN